MPERELERPSLATRLLAHLPALERFVRRRMGADLASRESASDIVQSTVREVLRGGGVPGADDAAFERWLLGAAEHKLQNRARFWRAERRAEGEPASAAPEPAAAEPVAGTADRPTQEALLREEVERLARAFLQLTPEHRDVLVRSQIHGLDHASIAAETGRTPGAVRKLVARALARLSDELGDDPQSEAMPRAGRTPVP
jgi:RNA polymerase sigma factor (sigma-70 family)